MSNKNLPVITSMGFVSEKDDLTAVLMDTGLRKKDMRRFTIGEKRLLTSCIKALKKGKLENTGDTKGGIIVGSNWGNIGSMMLEDEESLYEDDFENISPFILLKSLSSTPTNRCSIILGLNSVSITFGGGDNSGVQAVVEAARLLKTLSNVDFILAGTFEVITESRLKLLERLNTNPLKSLVFRSRLFSRLLLKNEKVFRYLWKFQAQNPLPLGGSGTILVEKADHASARGADILAIIKDHRQVTFSNKADSRLVEREIAALLNNGKLTDAGDGTGMNAGVDGVISLHHLDKRNRKLEKKILKKIGFKGGFFPVDEIVGNNFSVSDIGAIAFGTSLFQFTDTRRILIDSFGQCSYSGLVLEKYETGHNYNG